MDVPRGGSARIRLEISGGGAWDAQVRRDRVKIVPAASGDGADALIIGEAAAWERIARDYRGGMEAFRDGSLVLRRNLHLGVGFLAATSGADEPGRLRFDTVKTDVGRISMMEAGQGEPLILIHGL